MINVHELRSEAKWQLWGNFMMTMVTEDAPVSMLGRLSHPRHMEANVSSWHNLKRWIL